MIPESGEDKGAAFWVMFFEFLQHFKALYVGHYNVYDGDIDSCGADAFQSLQRLCRAKDTACQIGLIYNRPERIAEVFFVINY